MFKFLKIASIFASNDFDDLGNNLTNSCVIQSFALS